MAKKYTKQIKALIKKADPLGDVLSKISDEIALLEEVAPLTRIEYEKTMQRVRQSDTFDMGPMAKGSRYKLRAAGLYVMRKELRALNAQAKRVQKNGITGLESGAERQQLYFDAIAKAASKLQDINKWNNLNWQDYAVPTGYKEASHKTKAATDDELIKFYKAAERSSFYNSFLVAEFGGVRGQELAKRVRVEIDLDAKKQGKRAIKLYIESAKCDGDKKGLDLRCVVSEFPADAAKEVQKRWLELAKLAASSKTGAGFVVGIEETPKSTAGMKFTQACKFVSKAAEVKVSAYSFRNRFSAQAKQANPGDAEAVALALGHQTTKTQMHYARTKRGAGGISPVNVSGINVSGVAIRGAKQRTGPPLHTKEKSALSKVVGSAPSAPPRPSRRL